MSRVGAVVLARLTSERLPGKALAEVAGKPLVGYVLDRLARVQGLDATVLATSTDPADDALAAWSPVPVHRGPLDDVAGRVLGAAREHRLDAVARVNGDSPWLDPELLSRAIASWREGGHDLVTNLAERTWPYGVAAEVVSVDALERAVAAAPPEEREHVTRPLYARPEGFSILALPAADPPDPELRLTVDTDADLERFARLVALFSGRAAEVQTAEVAEAARNLERP